MSLPGYDAALGGIHARSEFSLNLITDAKKVKNLGERLKKVVRNFARGIQNIFEGIQEPRWPRASNSHCTPLVTTAGFCYYNALSVILVTQSCIIHQMKGHLMLYNSCMELSIKKCDVRVQIYENHGSCRTICRHFVFSSVIFVT